jgi:ketosteroid isomerase-like protein
MRVFVILTILFCYTNISGQDLKKEIDAQVWKPFIEGYNSFDTEKFISVYSKSVIRVPIDEKKILSYAEYKKAISREYQFNKNYKIKATIELRFTERIHNSDKGYERGIFKIRLTDNNGKPETIYSRFQVLLQKEADVWKITFDSDSAEGSRLTEKDFQSAMAM